jgi:hypothetical protein
MGLSVLENGQGINNPARQQHSIQGQAQHGLILINKKTKVAEKVHTQQAIDTGLSAEIQHANLKLPNIPVTHRQ